MNPLTPRRNWFQILSVVMIVFLILEVALLILQNRDLRAQLSVSANKEMMEPLKHGEKVGTIKIETLNEEMSEISYADPRKKYLLFVFSTTCPHCEKNFVNWQMIADKGNRMHCVIRGISVHDFESTRKYMETKKPNFDVVVLADTSFKSRYRVNGVLETILVNGDGALEKIWIGELTNEQTKEIQILMSSPKLLTNQQTQ